MVNQTSYPYFKAVFFSAVLLLSTCIFEETPDDFLFDKKVGEAFVSSPDLVVSGNGDIHLMARYGLIYERTKNVSYGDSRRLRATVNVHYRVTDDSIFIHNFPNISSGSSGYGQKEILLDGADNQKIIASVPDLSNVNIYQYNNQTWELENRVSISNNDGLFIPDVYVIHRGNFYTQINKVHFKNGTHYYDEVFALMENNDRIPLPPLPDSKIIFSEIRTLQPFVVDSEIIFPAYYIEQESFTLFLHSLNNGDVSRKIKRFARCETSVVPNDFNSISPQNCSQNFYVRHAFVKGKYLLYVFYNGKISTVDIKDENLKIIDTFNNEHKLGLSYPFNFEIDSSGTIHFIKKKNSRIGNSDNTGRLIFSHCKISERIECDTIGFPDTLQSFDLQRFYSFTLSNDNSPVIAMVLNPPGAITNMMSRTISNSTEYKGRLYLIRQKQNQWHFKLLEKKFPDALQFITSFQNR